MTAAQYLICVGGPGTSKTAAFKRFVLDPIHNVAKKINEDEPDKKKQIRLDQFTMSALHNHLVHNNGGYYMFYRMDIVQQIILV